MRFAGAERVTLLLALCTLGVFWASESSAKPRPRPAARRATAAAYRSHVSKWHAREAGAKAPVGASGRPKLVLENVNTKARVELEVLSGDGGFSDTERARARSVLGDSRKNAEREIDAALLDLLYRLQLHFDAPCVRIVSAYRAGGASQHARGRAADIVIPGVEDAKLAAHARALGGTGVGLYPKSGFVHVDVRERSHYWVDGSGPGERARPARRKAGGKKPVKQQGAKQAAPHGEG